MKRTEEEEKENDEFPWVVDYTDEVLERIFRSCEKNKTTTYLDGNTYFGKVLYEKLTGEKFSSRHGKNIQHSQNNILGGTELIAMSTRDVIKLKDRIRTEHLKLIEQKSQRM